MKHNKWFEETFLASLKDGQWITEKQVNVCRKYMTLDRYYGMALRLASGNTEYIVRLMKKGYGQFIKIDHGDYNIEEHVTDMYGRQYT